jgi:hypothetical protein
MCEPSWGCPCHWSSVVISTLSSPLPSVTVYRIAPFSKVHLWDKNWSMAKWTCLERFDKVMHPPWLEHRAWPSPSEAALSESWFVPRPCERDCTSLSFIKVEHTVCSRCFCLLYPLNTLELHLSVHSFLLRSSIPTHGCTITYIYPFSCRWGSGAFPVYGYYKNLLWTFGYVAKCCVDKFYFPWVNTKV